MVVLFSEGPDPRVRRLFALRDADEDGLRVLRLRHRPSRLPRAATALTILGLSAVLGRLRREGFVPDVLHAHTLSAAVGAVALGRAHGIPVVVSEHWSGFALGTLTPWQRVLARTVIPRADLVCPVSESLARAVAAHAPGARLRVVPNVVDTDLFAPRTGARSHAGDGPPKLLAVALLSEKKGLDVLLDALARRPEPARLDVVGEGPALAGLTARARELGLDGAVRFHGARTREEVARRLAEADLFVQASRVETFGVALVEALAAGVPVVATDVGVASELVDERTGVLVGPGDPDVLARGIDRALAGLEGFDPAVAAARARERCGPEPVAAAWDAVYAAAIDSRRHGRHRG